MKRSHIAAVLLGLGLVAGAPAADGAERNKDEADRVVVEVENHNWLDMRIYVEQHGQLFRIGTVNSFNAERLTVPRSLVRRGGALQLIAVPIGSGRRLVAPELEVWPGDYVDFTIENNFNLSTLIRR